MGVSASTPYPILNSRLTYKPSVDIQTNDFWSVYNRVQDQGHTNVQGQWNPNVQGQWNTKFPNQWNPEVQGQGHFIHQEHLETKKNSLFKCHLCHYTARLESSLLKHVHSKHSKPSDERKYECDTCTRTYKWQSSLCHHKKYECHNDPRFKFICHYCNRDFTQKVTLRNHISVIHSEVYGKVNFPPKKSRVRRSRQQ